MFERPINSDWILYTMSLGWLAYGLIYNDFGIILSISIIWFILVVLGALVDQW